MVEYFADAGTELVQVGKVVTPHGLNGYLNVKVETDFPERFKVGTILYLGRIPRKILGSFFTRRGMVVLQFDGITDRAKAETFLGYTISIDITSINQLQEGHYYHYQILGLNVYTIQGEHLGKITEIISTGNNDVYAIFKNGDELLLPAISDVIREVNVSSGIMRVKIPDGLRPIS